MPCDTQRPSPVPFPGFVEKNGSKICAMSSSGIPSRIAHLDLDRVATEELGLGARAGVRSDRDGPLSASSRRR